MECSRPKALIGQPGGRVTGCILAASPTCNNLYELQEHTRQNYGYTNYEDISMDIQSRSVVAWDLDWKLRLAERIMKELLEIMGMF